MSGVQWDDDDVDTRLWLSDASDVYSSSETTRDYRMIYTDGFKYVYCA